MSDLLSGLANLTKQVTSNISTYEIRKFTDKVQGMVMNYTEAEALVREATNEDPWGPTGPQMKEICNLTFQYDGFHQVTEMLWQRMFEDNKFAWRRVYKSLTLLNYLLQHGSERVITNSRDHMFQLRSLEHYKHTDEKGKDQGVNIRHRVGIILEWLNDEDKLRAERKKAKTDNKERYQGFTSSEIRAGRGGAYNGNSSSSSSNFKKNEDFDSNWNSSKKSDDYSNKEVNAFQFPDEVRGHSNSPELGFRQDPEPEDDGFGDFAQARSSSKTASGNATQVNSFGLARVKVAHASPIPPPTKSSATTNSSTAASVDLLGLDAPVTNSADVTIPAVDFFATMPPSGVTVNTSMVAPPRPPSGGGLVSPPAASAQATSQPALLDDLFGAIPNLSSSSTPAPTANQFQVDWTSTNFVPAQSSAPQTNTFADFNAFGTFASVSAPPTTTTTPAKATLGMDDLFGSLSLQPTSSPIIPATPVSTPVQALPKSEAKIGNTWTGTGGLIDLDNLGSKSGPVKQSPSLNQMQKNKQGGSGSIAW